MRAAFDEEYADAPFVRMRKGTPRVSHVRGTNFCDVTVRISRGYVIILACTDNLIKGAAGVAVQNFNLMHGYDELTALW